MNGVSGESSLVLQWVQALGPLAGFLAVLVYLLLKERGAAEQLTVAEFRANISAFKEHHEDERKLMTRLVDMQVAQTELMRNVTLTQDTLATRHEEDMRTIAASTATISLAMTQLMRESGP